MRAGPNAAAASLLPAPLSGPVGLVVGCWLVVDASLMIGVDTQRVRTSFERVAQDKTTQENTPPCTITEYCVWDPRVSQPGHICVLTASCRARGSPPWVYKAAALQ